MAARRARQAGPRARPPRPAGPSAPAPTPPRRDRQERILPWLAALLAVAAFAPTLANGFVLDDEPVIVFNRLVKSLASVPVLLTTDYWEGSWGAGLRQNLYRPLVLMSFTLNYAAGGLTAWGYHLVNVVANAAVAAALWALARRLGLGPLPAFVGAALFAVHPLHVEPVSGLVGRSELFMALGVLGAWWAYLAAEEAGPRAPRWRMLSWGAFGLALLSKEQAVVLPALLALSDLAGGARSGPWWRRLRPGRYVPYVLVLGGYLGLRAVALTHPLAPGTIAAVDNPLTVLPAGLGLQTALAVAGRYLALFVWPARLSADYSYDAIPPVTSVADPALLGAVLAWGSLLALGGWAVWRGQRVLAAGAGLTVISFLPVSNLVVLIGTIMGERLFYLPSAGLCLLAGWAWGRLVPVPWGRGPARAAGVGLALVVLLLGARTVVRARDWQTTDTLWSKTVLVVPRSVKAQAARGKALMDRGQFREAEAAFRRGRDILEQGRVTDQPSLGGILNDLGVLHFREGEQAGPPRAAEKYAVAEGFFRQALARWESSLGPDHPLVTTALNNLAGLAGARGDYEQAAELYRRVLAIRERSLGRGHPAVALALNNLGLARYHQARYAEAEELYRQAIAILERSVGPRDPVLRPRLQNYAVLLRKTGRPEEAARVERRLDTIPAEETR